MTQKTTTYPDDDQRQRWEERAEEMGMSLSEYVEAMVEAGQKKFDADVTPDETVAELREQRNHYRSELREARDRIQRLEDRLDHTERATILEFVRENPGATYREIANHTAETVQPRVSEHLESSDKLHRRDDGYYISEDTTDE